jgi:hypothetical protein
MGADPTAGLNRGAALLAASVRQAAATQAVIDVFIVLAGLTAVALLLAVAHRPAPLGPASHRPLFGNRAGLAQ